MGEVQRPSARAAAACGYPPMGHAGLAPPLWGDVLPLLVLPCTEIAGEGQGVIGPTFSDGPADFRPDYTPLDN